LFLTFKGMLALSGVVREEGGSAPALEKKEGGEGSTNSFRKETIGDYPRGKGEQKDPYLYFSAGRRGGRGLFLSLLPKEGRL